MTKILEIRDLRTYFYPPMQPVAKAVDGVSFSIEEGETLCLVGESGCGKSVTALSIMQLLPTPPVRYESGEILFEGEDLLQKSERQLRAYRGNRLSMIYQEPMTSLNPVYTIGMQLTEPLIVHQGMPKKKALNRAEEMLRLVGISDPKRIMNEYPHQHSGGIQQRIMIAMGLICEPKLLIADEPTTALDVTIQAQIIELMEELKEKLHMTLLFITHDLGVVAQIADRVAVMYAGKIVETGGASSIYNHPQHPYTQGLLSCVPSPNQERGTLKAIPGTVPSAADYPPGCRFSPRCPYAEAACRETIPELQENGYSYTACFRCGKDSETEGTK
ncbi:MAG: ABC transporter ATP-binding protein [Clostridia bacterium]|nr:ABC transporter ATP-binding protein [Clostridia bacterium]